MVKQKPAPDKIVFKGAVITADAERVIDIVGYLWGGKTPGLALHSDDQEATIDLDLEDISAFLNVLAAAHVAVSKAVALVSQE